jgi:hypothetical protein
MPANCPGTRKRIREALATPGRPGVRVIAKQFGVDPGTVRLGDSIRALPDLCLWIVSGRLVSTRLSSAWPKAPEQLRGFLCLSEAHASYNLYIQS